MPIAIPFFIGLAVGAGGVFAFSDETSKLLKWGAVAGAVYLIGKRQGVF